MAITDAQLRTLRNNALEVPGELLEKLTKEEAMGIISDMYSGGYTRNSKAVGTVEFWSKVKNSLEAK